MIQSHEAIPGEVLAQRSAQEAGGVSNVHHGRPTSNARAATEDCTVEVSTGRGAPMGSGAMKSSRKLMIQQRMKLSGQLWSLVRGRGMVRLRLRPRQLAYGVRLRWHIWEPPKQRLKADEENLQVAEIKRFLWVFL